MKKHLFALYGRSNSGKTTTIKTACRSFGNTPGVERLLCDPNPKSTQEDLVCGYKINGVRVGFSSGGDYPCAVKYGLEKLKGYEIIVCATRSKGGTMDYVYKYKKGYQLYWIRQPVMDNDYDPKPTGTVYNLDREPYYEKRNAMIVKLILELINAELNLP